jgi:multidrug resistance efflux pump
MAKKKKPEGQVDFGDERATFQASLDKAREELAALEAQLEEHGAQTGRARASLQKMRVLLGGKLPAPKKTRGRGRGKIKALEVNDETGRPARGSRRQQVEDICAMLGKGGQTFRSVEVLRALEAAEGEVSNGMKSYTYTVLNTLGEDGFLTKVGRGKWTLG